MRLFHLRHKNLWMFLDVVMHGSRTAFRRSYYEKPWFSKHNPPCSLKISDSCITNCSRAATSPVPTMNTGDFLSRESCLIEFEIASYLSLQGILCDRDAP